MGEYKPTLISTNVAPVFWSVSSHKGEYGTSLRWKTRKNTSTKDKHTQRHQVDRLGVPHNMTVAE